MGQKHPSLRPALARVGKPSGQEQVWPLMPHLEFAQLGWVTGGERNRQQVSVPLLDQSPPAASSSHGSNPVLALFPPRCCVLSPSKPDACRAHTLPTSTQMHARPVLFSHQWPHNRNAPCAFFPINPDAVQTAPYQTSSSRKPLVLPAKAPPRVRVPVSAGGCSPWLSLSPCVLYPLPFSHPLCSGVN